MKDLYDAFAYDYDEFGAIENYLGAEKDFFNKLFKENKVSTVLDCACGTGQHLYMLSQLGYQLWGSDYSLSMLKQAHKNLQETTSNIPLCQCDFRYLEDKFDIKFDAIVCLTSSLPHLHTDKDLLQALQSMKNRLNNDGLLVLTSGTTHYTLTLPPIEVVINREDFSRIFVKEQNDNFQTIHIIDLFHTEEQQKSNQYDITYRILLDKEYYHLLTKAGFSDIKIYGDYNMSPYDKNSWRLIVVAKKSE